MYLLTLAPFPDPRNDTRWDGGLGTVPGARVAQDEINSHPDLLPGHHIELIVENIEACSNTNAFTGLQNLIKYTANSPCHPVTAVIGLFCSSHTSILSLVAGFKLQNDLSSPHFEYKTIVLWLRAHHTLSYKTSSPHSELLTHT